MQPDSTSPETFTEPGADRPPTKDEEQAAERGAQDVDVERVAEHHADANERGAGVQGEGQIEPG